MTEEKNEVSIIAEVHENPFADFVRSIAMAVTPIVNDTVKQYETENGKGPISSETCVCCGKAVEKGWADLYVPTSDERTNFDRYVLCRACVDTVFKRNTE